MSRFEKMVCVGLLLFWASTVPGFRAAGAVVTLGSVTGTSGSTGRHWPLAEYGPPVGQLAPAAEPRAAPEMRAR